MALRVRFSFSASASLGYSVERLSDGKFHDFSDGTFKTTPSTLISALTAGTGSYIGLYTITFTPTPIAQWTDGPYAVFVHNTASSNAIIGTLSTTFLGGDEAEMSMISLDLGAALAGGSASSFTASGSNLSVTPGAYPGQWVKFATGTNRGQRRQIQSYTVPSGVPTFALSSAFGSAPGVGDVFVVG